MKNEDGTVRMLLDLESPKLYSDASVKEEANKTGQVTVVVKSKVLANPINTGGELYLGKLSKKSSAGSSVGFTLEALYDDQKIVETDAWSACVLKWRFEPIVNEQTTP